MDSLANGQSNSIGLSTSCIGFKTAMHNTVIDAMEADVVHINNPCSAVEESSADEIMEILPFAVRKEVSSPVPTPNSGDQCFVGGLLGPDGTNRYLGKWCKRTQPNGSVLSSTTMQDPSTSTRDLIAVGADGRGGRVKILRSQNQLDVKGSSVLPKRSKSGSKQSSQQSRGCMQIEHFFAKAD